MLMGQADSPKEEPLSTYDLRSLNLPKLSGIPLKLFTLAVENPALRVLLMGNLLENGGIPKLRDLHLEEPPTLQPLITDHKRQESFSPDSLNKSLFAEATSREVIYPFKNTMDYARAYRESKVTPLEIAEKALASIEASDRSDPPLRAFISVCREDVLAQAKAASERIRSGKSLSLLDGVPVAIKDEMDMVPYPTTVGTKFLGSLNGPAKEDSTVVARLRAAGALLLGKSNMHEIGINPNGFNAHYGAVRNPYDPQRDPGGSSSGPAAAVAAGLCPLALGADGGGSIRIPAALCGIVGLKATYGRVSEFGAAPLCWSVAHLGPIGASIEDIVLAYILMAGVDPKDPNTLVQPGIRLDGWQDSHTSQTDLNGLTLGYYPEWFEHASPEVVRVCKRMLENFTSMGANVKEINIPELDAMRIAHAVTILCEIAACMRRYSDHRTQQGDAVRLSLVLGESLSAFEYLQAQRMRTRALAIFREIFKVVDVIISPATALPPQLIPTGGLPGGWSDLSVDTEMMRYVYPANLTGNPAIVFPAGYEEAGLPIGMQAMGRHWEEHILLRVAKAASQVVERRLPKVYYRILAD